MDICLELVLSYFQSLILHDFADFLTRPYVLVTSFVLFFSLSSDPVIPHPFVKGRCFACVLFFLEQGVHNT